MSFGCSVSDVVLLIQLAWKTVQNSRKACGEHDELTREVLSLHVVLRRLEQECRDTSRPFNRPNETYREELEVIVAGCKKVLKVLDIILQKYNALSERERSVRKIWQRIRFGNGQMTDLVDLRAKMVYYTTLMNLFLNMVSMGSVGRVEKKMDDAGGDLREIKLAVNGITAHLITKSRHEGSFLTAYADDDRAVWKEFRRELVNDGFSSSVLRKHKATIKAYVTELGSRGLLDEEDPREVNVTPTDLAAFSDTGSIEDVPETSTTAHASHDLEPASKIAGMELPGVKSMQPEIRPGFRHATDPRGFVQEPKPQNPLDIEFGGIRIVEPRIQSLNCQESSWRTKTNLRRPHTKVIVDSGSCTNDHVSEPVHADSAKLNTVDVLSGVQASSFTNRDLRSVNKYTIDRNTSQIEDSTKAGRDVNEIILGKVYDTNPLGDVNNVNVPKSALHGLKEYEESWSQRSGSPERSNPQLLGQTVKVRGKARANLGKAAILNEENAKHVPSNEKYFEPEDTQSMARDRSNHIHEGGEATTRTTSISEAIPLSPEISCEEVPAQSPPFGDKKNTAQVADIFEFKEDDARSHVDGHGRIIENPAAKFEGINRQYHTFFEGRCVDLIRASTPHLHCSHNLDETLRAEFNRLYEGISCVIVDDLDRLGPGKCNKLKTAVDYLREDVIDMLSLMDSCVRTRSVRPIKTTLWHCYHGRIAPLCVHWACYMFHTTRKEKQNAYQTLILKLLMVIEILGMVQLLGIHATDDDWCNELKKDTVTMITALGLLISNEIWAWVNPRVGNGHWKRPEELGCALRKDHRKIVVRIDVATRKITSRIGSRCTCC